MFAVLVLVTVLAWALGWSQHGGVAKPAVSLIEAVPASLPGFHIPQIQWHWFVDMSGSAVAIAVLGLLEALAIAKAIAHKSGQQLDYNRQILAEGVGNLVGGFFHCMPGAGSLSRTAINWQAGALTRLSGVFTAVIVAVVVLTIGPLTAYVPKAALAGLLIVAAVRLIDVDRLRYIFRGSRYDAVLVSITAATGVFVDIELAILIGVAASLLGYMPRAARLRVTELVVTPERVVRERQLGDPDSGDIVVVDIEGELFFGAAPEFERELDRAAALARLRGVDQLILRVKRLRNADAVSLEVLDKFLRHAREGGLTVSLAGVRPDLLAALQRFGIAPDRVFPEEERDLSATLKAIRRARASSPAADGAYYLV